MYDIFISYRRNGGSERAELLKAVLEKNGIASERIFMDTHALKGGDFKTRLKDAICESSNFIVLITKDCFEDAKEGDFFVYEIAEAIKLKKNIVPVVFDGENSFAPEALPESIKALSSHNAVSYSHEYADASFKKLCSFLVGDFYTEHESTQTLSKRTKSLKFWTIGVLAAILAGAAIWTFSLTENNDENSHMVSNDARIIKTIEASTIMVRRGSHPYATAFLISKDGFALTANHILNNESITDTTYLYIDNDIYRIQGIVYENAQQDFTLFRIDSEGTEFDSFLTVATESPEIGSEVWVSSYDFYSSGYPSMITTGRIESVTSDRVRTGAKIQGGFSGAPMCNKKGEVIGIALSSLEKNDICVASFGLDLHLIRSILDDFLKISNNRTNPSEDS